jgi:hypothetical protein
MQYKMIALRKRNVIANVDALVLNATLRDIHQALLQIGGILGSLAERSPQTDYSSLRTHTEIISIKANALIREINLNPRKLTQAHQHRIQEIQTEVQSLLLEVKDVIEKIQSNETVSNLNGDQRIELQLQNTFAQKEHSKKIADLVNGAITQVRQQEAANDFTFQALRA